MIKLLVLLVPGKARYVAQESHSCVLDFELSVFGLNLSLFMGSL